MDVLAGRIVVGYDGSDQSRAAVDWAAAEAHHRGLPLTVLHVLDHYSMLANVMGPAGWPAALADDAGAVATAGADRARARVRGIEVTAATATDHVSAALIEASKDASLLVTTPHSPTRY